MCPTCNWFESSPLLEYEPGNHNSCEETLDSPNIWPTDIVVTTTTETPELIYNSPTWIQSKTLRHSPLKKMNSPVWFLLYTGRPLQVLSGPISFLNSPLPGSVRARGNTRKDLKVRVITMLLVLTGQSPQTLLILLYVELPQLIVFLHLPDSSFYLDSFQFHFLTIGVRT